MTWLNWQNGVTALTWLGCAWIWFGTWVVHKIELDMKRIRAELRADLDAVKNLRQAAELAASEMVLVHEAIKAGMEPTEAMQRMEAIREFFEQAEIKRGRNDDAQH